MNQQEALAFRSKWQEAKQLESQEQQTATDELRFQQLNALFQLAQALGLFHSCSEDREKEEEVVWRRWARLKG